MENVQPHEICIYNQTVNTGHIFPLHSIQICAFLQIKIKKNVKKSCLLTQLKQCCECDTKNAEKLNLDCMVGNEAEF